MQYRHLGRSGLQLSVLSFGSWVSFGPQLYGDGARECLAAAYDAGINFFDNAEVYAGGESETIMGRAIKELGWPRHTYVVSSKFFWGIEDSVNTKNTLNRKYLLHAIEGSLHRLGLDFLDLIFCHRADPQTPIDETVWAMHDIIESGRALYWGTSEWSADELRTAVRVAERDHLHRPVMDQPQYNLLERHKVEVEFAPLYDEIGLGLTTWSPLASGLLSGKYLDGVPANSRATLSGYGWLAERLTDPQANRSVRELKQVADDLGVTLAQLSIAWCAANPHVSTVITGASRVEQVHENIGALVALDKLTPDVLARIDGIFAPPPR
ncbi:MAG TPA: aldo/keto reductase [Candidatus Dormibacteraeota bacterium]|nr:aldo/keto reductase [Candidatus Dormibacteraeota bacterium]